MNVSGEIRRRLEQYAVFRLLVTLLGFLMVTFYVTMLSRETRLATSLYLGSLLTAYLVFGVASVATLRRWAHITTLHRPQLLVDFALQSVLVWSTGGVLSIFSPLLFVTLAAATAVSSTRDAFVFATLTTIALAGITLAQSFGFTPVGAAWASWIFSGEKSAFIASYLVASVLALYAISTLGSAFSHGLRRSESLQEEILENMAEGLLAVDREGRVIRLNGEGRRLLGLSGEAGAYRGKPLRDVLRECGAACAEKSCFEEISDAFAQARRERFETQLVDVHGVEKPVEVKVSTVNDESGKLRFRIGLFTDLSLQQEIEEAGQRIRRLEELQVMAVGIAHEIRNPLASIRGCVQEISRLSAGSAGPARYAEIVVRESDRLDRIVEDFFQFARSMPVDVRPLDVAEVIKEAVILLRKRPEFGSREIDLRIEKDLQAVLGDRDRLVQVFLNLGINAIQATDDVRGRLGFVVSSTRISSHRARRALDARQEQPGIDIVVWDNGVGVDPALADKVFSPFFSTKEKGMGLGLSIVERIAREHGGTVRLESKPGVGTEVRLQLPALAGAQPAPSGALADGTVAEDTDDASEHKELAHA